MGVIGDNAISKGDLGRRLYDLEQLVRELIAGRRLEAASIGRGGVTVKDGGTFRVKDIDGVDLAWMGLDPQSGLRGTVLRRAGGAVAFAAFGTGAVGDSGFAALYDLAEQYVVSDDIASGRGLARPYIPVQLGEVTIPTTTTTSGTFTDMAAGTMPVQHPVLFAHVLARASDGTTAGEVRMTLNGEQVGEPATVDAGAFVHMYLGPATVDAVYEYGHLHRVRVQARRTAGSGEIGVRVMSMHGLESAWANAGE
ncbi:hypothetical protein Vqi01_06500 [Micromonospora qiuiae]|uniref:Uncharacterized protein n=1 Tax=Micromonospora qiuiae TaxID=502268 RepID=A0ABQ4J606_9ACTN|nr:hypothetical protein [Micromonospora qiuiae]GIJ25488.1 hypothetical protein Vqi01_06500 [Micromonospora qiuiae]